MAQRATDVHLQLGSAPSPHPPESGGGGGDMAQITSDVHLHLGSVPPPPVLRVVVGDGIWHREIYRCTPTPNFCSPSPPECGSGGGGWYMAQRDIQMYT